MVAFNPRKFTDPDLLKTIAPNRLIAFLLPWKDYLAKPRSHPHERWENRRPRL
jgi:hypothetical protein